MDQKAKLKGFIQTELARDQGDVNVEEESLVESGIIDSVGIMKLVDFIEQELGVTIGDDELLPENFETLDDISRLVASKAS